MWASNLAHARTKSSQVATTFPIPHGSDRASHQTPRSIGETHMRIRATVAAVSGALALSAFALPAAHAADSTSSSFRTDATKAFAASHAGSSGITAFSTAADPTPLDVT